MSKLSKLWNAYICMYYCSIYVPLIYVAQFVSVIWEPISDCTFPLVHTTHARTYTHSHMHTLTHTHAGTNTPPHTHTLHTVSKSLYSSIILAKDKYAYSIEWMQQNKNTLSACCQSASECNIDQAFMDQTKHRTYGSHTHTDTHTHTHTHTHTQTHTHTVF
jgi:hypothetical protein